MRIWWLCLYYKWLQVSDFTLLSYANQFLRELHSPNFASFSRFYKNNFPWKLFENCQFVKFTKINLFKNLKILNRRNHIHAFLMNHPFFNSASRLLNWWIEFQMLLRCCLILITMIILKHIIYLLYLCPYLVLDLLICLCRVFVIYFSFSASFSLPLII